MPCIVIHSGCSKRTPQAGQLTNNTNPFLTITEAKSQIEVAAGSGPGERPIPSS